MPDWKVVSAALSVIGILLTLVTRFVPLKAWGQRIASSFIRSRLWIFSRPPPDLEKGSGPLGNNDDRQAQRTLRQVYDVTLRVFKLYFLRREVTTSEDETTRYQSQWPRAIP
ncbi:hypothetical protein BJY01DRAFT_230499 [Aspergillus pseudoustus]|uniref:Uncharacterized protein n=1 Tax=Aspergillus pseudoustus TaxID=1810923 RepID=A0ABR4I9A0_9EURO